LSELDKLDEVNTLTKNESEKSLIIQNERFDRQNEELIIVIKEIDVRSRLDRHFEELITNQNKMSTKTIGISNTLIQVKSLIEKDSKASNEWLVIKNERFTTIENKEDKLLENIEQGLKNMTTRQGKSNTRNLEVIDKNKN
jgi:hypothetical protein